MTYETTIPTRVKKSEYKKAQFAIDIETADHYLLLPDGSDLWVGRDENSRDNSAEFPQEKVLVTDENGSITEITAYVLSTSKAWNDLDLAALANGKIEWK